MSDLVGNLEDRFSHNEAQVYNVNVVKNMVVVNSVDPHIGCFQAIKTDVWLIFSFITCDKTEFLSPMMFSNEYIPGI